MCMTASAHKLLSICRFLRRAEVADNDLMQKRQALPPRQCLLIVLACQSFPGCLLHIEDGSADKIVLGGNMHLDEVG